MNCHGFAHIIIILKTQLIKKELKFLSSQTVDKAPSQEGAFLVS